MQDESIEGPAQDRIRLSVIITNYNYAQFVATAIESVLTQDERIELIVVDDCSTDASRDVISRYADRIKPVFLEQNQGQGGGFNAGFIHATGDLVMFLDSDDFLLPGAAQTIIDNYDPDAALYLYRMKYADETGKLGRLYPPLQVAFAEGDLSGLLRDVGRYSGTVTSGQVFSRTVLAQVMPMDPEGFRYGGDGYVAATAPLYGDVRGFEAAISGYRQHANQHTKFLKAYAKRARWRISHDAERYAAIRLHADKLGLPVAGTLGANDPENVHERMVSLLFEPELHPVQGDTVLGLVRRAAEINRQQAHGPSVGVVQAFWIAFALLPMGVKRQVMTWKIDEQTRPRWLKSFGRSIRRIFRIGSF